jgi:CDP-diacylglycerol--serine O-phosphatidyltransferase
VGTTCVLVANDLVSGIIVVATALLMISRIPYAHFGRTILPKIPKVVRVLALGAFLFMLALGVHRDNYLAPLLVSFVAALTYLISPLFWGKGQKETLN